MATQSYQNNLPSFLNALESDQAMREEFENKPMETLKKAAANTIPDTRVYRMVVGSLGLALLLCLLAAAWITIAGQGTRPVPDIFITAASTIVGALAGLLAPQP